MEAFLDREKRKLALFLVMAVFCLLCTAATPLSDEGFWSFLIFHIYSVFVFPTAHNVQNQNDGLHLQGKL